jgi:hypothetical protein
MSYIDVPGRRLGFLLFMSASIPAMCALNSLPRASRTWPERSVPSGRVRDTISLYRGNLTYRQAGKLLPQRPTAPAIPKLRTLSRITNGPFTPPMVLYRIRGVTEIMRGSTTSGIVAVVGGLERECVTRARFRGPRSCIPSKMAG